MSQILSSAAVEIGALRVKESCVQLCLNVLSLSLSLPSCAYVARPQRIYLDPDLEDQSLIQFSNGTDARAEIILSFFVKD